MGNFLSEMIKLARILSRENAWFRRALWGCVAALAAAGLGAMAAMLAAGMFEHNFGDSEFLMLLLLLITLPFAADAPPSAEEAAAERVGAAA